MLKNKLLSAMGGSEPTDPNFSNTVLLLHGDGTNGAQNNTFLDSSTNNFSITRNGNTTQGSFSPFSKEPGKWGVAFDGMGDYLASQISSDLMAFGNGDFTIEMWIHFNNTVELQVPYDQRPYETQGAYPTIYVYLGYLRFFTNGVDLIATPVSTGQWYHIAVSRSGNTTRLFKDGVLAGTFETLINYLNGGNGRPGIGGGAYSQSLYLFNGTISNLRIVKGTALYTSNFTPSTAPLTAVAGTSLLCCQDNRFKDNSANNFTLTPYGNVAVTPFSPFANSAAYDPAVNGGSGYFDGSGDHLRRLSITLAGDFTIKGWAYLNEGGDYVFAVGDDYTNTGIALWRGVYSSDSPSAYGYAIYAGNAPPRIAEGQKTNLNEWVFFQVSRQNGVVFLHINGVLQGSWASSTTFSGPVTVGAGFFNGAVYGSCKGYISSLRVSNIYESAVIPTAPLTAVANTSLLLNFTNAGIYDSTGMNNLETVGNAQVSTTVKKYGTGAMYFNNASGYNFLAVPYNDTFWIGSGDYTCECWVNLSTFGEIVGAFSLSNPYPGWAMSTSFGGSGKLTVFFANQTGSYPTDTQTITSSASISANTWTHIAFTKQGTTIRLFIDGNLDTTSTLNMNGSTTVGKSNQQINIGADSNSTTTPGRKITGYIDDLRITKGVARYTANFTPPARAFPNK